MNSVSKPHERRQHLPLSIASPASTRQSESRFPLVSALMLTAAVLFLAPSAARAEVSVSLVDKALKGQGWPALTVEVRGERLERLSLELTRSDGETVRLGGQGAAPGTRRRFELRQPDGEFTWEGKLVAVGGGGDERTMPLSFSTVVLPPPVVTVKDDAVDLDARSVTVFVDRPVSEVRMRVQDDGGQVLGEFRESVKEQFADGGSGPYPVTVSWTQPDDRTVLRIDMAMEDRHGFYQEVELYPWHISIPHEDVLFETGRSDIRDSERPKLEAAHKELVKAIERYGRFARVSLFIAGHTDTVGNAAQNQKLSEARARSIASWFRERGLKLPVHYVGFGESRLLVPTGDDVDESRNRRAEYIVAVQPPIAAQWKRLK